MPLTGIGDHPGLHVAMMKGGLRGHSGMANRRSTLTRARKRPRNDTAEAEKATICTHTHALVRTKEGSERIVKGRI